MKRFLMATAIGLLVLAASPSAWALRCWSSGGFLQTDATVCQNSACDTQIGGVHIYYTVLSGNFLKDKWTSRIRVTGVTGMPVSIEAVKTAQRTASETMTRSAQVTRKAIASSGLNIEGLNSATEGSKDFSFAKKREIEMSEISSEAKKEDMLLHLVMDLAHGSTSAGPDPAPGEAVFRNVVAAVTTVLNAFHTGEMAELMELAEALKADDETLIKLVMDGLYAAQHGVEPRAAHLLALMKLAQIPEYCYDYHLARADTGKQIVNAMATMSKGISSGTANANQKQLLQGLAALETNQKNKKITDWQLAIAAATTNLLPAYTFRDFPFPGPDKTYKAVLEDPKKEPWSLRDVAKRKSGIIGLCLGLSAMGAAGYFFCRRKKSQINITKENEK